MNVGIIGSGGREHALCKSVKNSSIVKNIYCIPGNAGTANIATNVDIDLDNFDNIKEFIVSKKIEFLIVGPEKPLADGLVDFLQGINIKIFGPNKAASQLEASKIFTKNLCKNYKIPTAKFGVFQNQIDSKKYIKKSNYPIVIKADGLAAGKGVYICENEKDSFQAIDEIFNGKFGVANEVLIEEFLTGEEMSFFVISDGVNFEKFGTAQDHKRVGEGDVGLNTGGMGAYSPSRLESDILNKKILDKIIKPTLRALEDLNTNFKGFLYAGLMIKDNEPFLIEYNIRMGDPECQVIIPRLKTNVLDIILASLNNELKNTKIKWKKEKCMTVVMCSKGYPKKYKTKIKIKNLEKVKLNKNSIIFHAGTTILDNHLVSIGGRVLNITCIGNNFFKIKKNIYKILKKINWRSGFFRKDIGWRII